MGLDDLRADRLLAEPRDRRLGALLALRDAPRVKALSLWQPWASLVAGGAKSIETRPRRVSYRGTLLIHAALRRPRPEDWDLDPVFLEALHRAGVHWPSAPRGAIIGACQLTDCLPTDRVEPSGDEELFGNFATGRWAWVLEAAIPIRTPHRTRGARGLWTPAGLPPRVLAAAEESQRRSGAAAGPIDTGVTSAARIPPVSGRSNLADA